MFINKSCHKIRVIYVIRHQNKQVCERSNYRDRPLHSRIRKWLICILYAYIDTKTSKNLDFATIS